MRTCGPAGPDPEVVAMDVTARVLAGLAGGMVVLGTMLSAVRTVVVPRAESVAITRIVFGVLRRFVDRVARLRQGYEWTDRVMAVYAPIALLCLPLVWLASIYVGFGLLFWAVGEGSLATALEISGSSLLTLGFTHPATAAGTALAFVGAAMTIAIVVLLLVTYLPAMYATFAERERLATLLETRAGSPPDPVELLTRLSRIHGLGQLDPMWEAWEDWFARVQESHTSQPALLYFRSQRSDQSWVTAAGAVLDAAALFVACVDHRTVAEQWESYEFLPRGGGPVQVVRMPQAEVCIRAGYLCLRHIAGVLGLPHDPDPAPDDPIAVTREEFDGAWDRMAEGGVPLVSDRDAAWVAFAGWRVNYEEALLRLANLVAAPEAPWVSDRSPVLSDRRPGRRRAI